MKKYIFPYSITCGMACDGRAVTEFSLDIFEEIGHCDVTCGARRGCDPLARDGEAPVWCSDFMIINHASN